MDHPPLSCTRRHLNTIRKLWSTAQPFWFCTPLDNDITIESFCFQFVAQKYVHKYKSSKHNS
uniref:Uncharacterized protein n=1 Tax=viral metagenome TaxID=1070528 RepID=A0A6C0BPT1_9ZZZZ